MRWLLALLLAGAAQAQQFSYLGQQILANGTSLANVPVGGLSSIEYVPSTGHYLAISDDRSDRGPARFYELTLDLAQFRRSAEPGDAGVGWVGMTTLLDLDGQPFRPNQVDPESLRLDARRNLIYWTSEGQRTSAAMQSPTVRRMHLDGKPAGEFAVPGYYKPGGSAGGLAAGDVGVYNNLAFESGAITPDGRTLWTATENGLAQDDLPAAYGRGSRTRLLSFDLETGQAGAEFVYEVGPVTSALARFGGFATNGVTDLLALSAHEFIAIERAFAIGAGNTVKLYLIDTRGATDVRGWPSIRGRDLVPVKRSLLLDLGTLRNDDGSRLMLDNIEGLTFGPLFDGKRTLILVSDNNFNPPQSTQFVALTIDGPLP